MAQSKDIMLYGLTTCAYCRKAKEFIEKLGLKFTYIEVDALSGDERKQTVSAVRSVNPQVSFPTIILTAPDGQQDVFVGLDEEAEDALEAVTK